MRTQEELETYSKASHGKPMRVQLALEVSGAIKPNSVLLQPQFGLVVADIEATASRLERGNGSFTAEAMRIAVYINSCQD